MVAYLADDTKTRPSDPGRAGSAAMHPRNRRCDHTSAAPMLPYACHLCEASYPNLAGAKRHVDAVSPRPYWVQSGAHTAKMQFACYSWAPFRSHLISHIT